MQSDMLTCLRSNNYSYVLIWKAYESYLISLYCVRKSISWESKCRMMACALVWVPFLIKSKLRLYLLCARHKMNKKSVIAFICPKNEKKQGPLAASSIGTQLGWVFRSHCLHISWHYPYHRITYQIPGPSWEGHSQSYRVGKEQLYSWISCQDMTSWRLTGYKACLKWHNANATPICYRTDLSSLQKSNKRNTIFNIRLTILFPHLRCKLQKI